MCAGRRGLAAHAAAASVLLVPAGAQMLYTEFFIREPAFSQSRFFHSMIARVSVKVSKPHKQNTPNPNKHTKAHTVW